MSYNITAFKQSSISLNLPLTFDFMEWVRTLPDRDQRGYENVGKRWCLEDRSPTAVNANLAQKTWELDFTTQSLSGTIENNELLVTDIDWRGEGSGHLYSDILLPLFRAFNGNLEAMVVWEGGDSIYRLSIHNGVVSEMEIK